MPKGIQAEKDANSLMYLPSALLLAARILAIVLVVIVIGVVVAVVLIPGVQDLVLAGRGKGHRC